MTKWRYDARVAIRPMVALFEARGAEQGLAKALAAAGLPWPQMSGRIDTRTKGVEVMRFGPMRVLIRADLEHEARLGALLETAFASVPDAEVVPVSDMYRSFSIAGPGADDVLRQGAPLDLSIGAFPQASVAATEIWAVTAIISRDSVEEPSYTLLVDIAFANYIADWLSVANGGSPQASPGVMTNPPLALVM